MDDVLRMAGELGQAIARHRHYQALRDAEEAVKADADATTLINSFNEHQEKLLRLTDERKPIEPEDKRKMAALQQRVMGHETLKRLQAAQVNFRYLMDTVNRAIHEALEPAGEERTD